MMSANNSEGKSLDQWIEEYAQCHQNPVNRFCHTIGIPMITVSLLLVLVGLPLWFFEVTSAMPLWVAVALFVIGWLLQFVGHAFEGKPPEFFRDRRFLRIGLLWWFRKIRGKA